MTEYAKFVDVITCTACRACEVSCKNWNDLPTDVRKFDNTYQSRDKVDGDTWNVVEMIEYEKQGGGFEWLFRHSACYHCRDAACEYVCPEDAITTTELGNVVVDQEVCVGCSYCVYHCPFDVIELADYIAEDGKTKQRAQKCDMCDSRIQEGLIPACVQSCPVGSINFGTREEMLIMAQERLEIAKESYPNAQIYDPASVDGLNMFHLLPDDPQVFGLPAVPKIPTAAVVWKEYANPLGKIAIGATGMALIGAYVTNKLFNKGTEDDDSEKGEETDVD